MTVRSSEKRRESVGQGTLEKRLLSSGPKDKPADIPIQHVGTSVEGGILNLRTRAPTRGEDQRKKGPLEACLGQIKRKGPTDKRNHLRETNVTHSDQAQRIDLINIEIQANLAQSFLTKATYKLEESVGEGETI